MRKYEDMSLFELMDALNEAAFKNSAENVKAISDIAKTVIEKCDAAQLSAGLSEKIINGGLAGINGLYYLIRALYEASFINSAENVKAISDIAKTVIVKCDAAQLSAGLSGKIIKIIYGDTADATGLYWLMRALNNAIDKNSAENLKAISDIAKRMIEKCDAAQLSVRLSEKIISGYLAGETGLYRLMTALNKAAFKNSAENVKAISEIAKTVIEKCDAAQLSVGLSEKIINGDLPGTTGLYFLMNALDNTVEKKSQENIKIIADLIIQMTARLDRNPIPDDQKKLLFSAKKNLSEPLKEYLTNKVRTMPIKEFEKMCSSQKLLGALIDHHSSAFGIGKTATRVFVDELLNKEKSEVIAQTILEKFSKGEIALPNSDSLKAIVQEEVKNRLDPEKSKDGNAVDQLTLAVLKTDIIQKQLLPRREFLENIAQTIWDEFSKGEIILSDADSLIAVVQKEVKKRLDPEKSKDENAVDQLTLAVLKTDIIQKQLLPAREKHKEKAEQSAALSQGPGLFASPSAEKKFRTIAAAETHEKEPSLYSQPRKDPLRRRQAKLEMDKDDDQWLTEIVVPRHKIKPPDSEENEDVELKEKPKPQSS